MGLISRVSSRTYRFFHIFLTMAEPATLYRLPFQLNDKRSVVKDLNTEKYWDSVGKQSFRGRPLVHTTVDLKKAGLKAVLLEVNSEEKTTKILEEIGELVECEYKRADDKYDNKQHETQEKSEPKPEIKPEIKPEMESETDPEQIKLDQIKLEDTTSLPETTPKNPENIESPPMLHALKKLDQIYSILN